MEKKEFGAIILDLEKKTYIVHTASFTIFIFHVYYFWHIQLEALPFADVFTTVFDKYKDFADIFLSNLAT